MKTVVDRHPSTPDGWLYRAIHEGFWIGPDPFPRDRSLVRELDGKHRAGRWNLEWQDAAYTSHEPETAYREFAGHYPPGCVARRFLDAQGVGLQVVVTKFVDLGPRGEPFRPDSLSMRQWMEYLDLLDPADPDLTAYRDSRLIATQWCLYDDHARLIVPSAPCIHADPPQLRWNSVFMIGHRGQYQERDLPDKARLAEEFTRRVV